MKSRDLLPIFLFCASIVQGVEQRDVSRLDNPAPISTIPTEVYTSADDGTTLTWKIYSLGGEKKRPVVILIHGGGFIKAAVPELWENVGKDLAAAGFLVFEPDYRLAPPGKLRGQKSSGRFPDQTNDVHRAVRSARLDSRGNGQVAGLGGSSGGYHVAFAALTGTPGDDQLDAGVCLSGPYDLADAESLEMNRNSKSKIFNYVGSEETSKLLAASPISFVTAQAPSLFLIHSAHEAIPAPQLPAMSKRLLSVGVSTLQQQLTLPGTRHSVEYWADVRDPAITFLRAAFSRGKSDAVNTASSGQPNFGVKGSNSR